MKCQRQAIVTITDANGIVRPYCWQHALAEKQRHTAVMVRLPLDEREPIAVDNLPADTEETCCVEMPDPKPAERRRVPYRPEFG